MKEKKEEMAMLQRQQKKERAEDEQKYLKQMEMISEGNQNSALLEEMRKKVKQDRKI